MDNNIKDAVLWAIRRMENLPSKSTEDQYFKAERRLLKELKNGILPGASKNRNTRSFKRSAIRYLFARRIIENFNSLNPNEKFISELFNIIKTIDAEALEAQKEYVSGKKNSNTEVKVTKRRSIPKGEDWRHEFFNFASKSKFIDCIRVMAACGCRPAEIENGVVVEQNENTTTFKIIGAKCRDGAKTLSNMGSGQELRVLTFDSNHPLMREIKSGKYQASAKGICDSTSHFGKIFPGRVKDYQISAYTFRHAAASDFKASGLTDEEISAALGHQSTDTQKLYGHRGKKGLKGLKSTRLNLISVTAKTPVRVIPKKSRFNKSKM